METTMKNELLERMFGTQIYGESPEAINYILSVTASKEIIQDYVGGFPLKKYTYSTGISELDKLAVKPEWAIKQFNSMPTLGFIRVYKNPSDGVVIVENGLGLGSQTYKFAFK